MDNFEIYKKPFCFLGIKSIGFLNPSEMAKPISNLVLWENGIPIDKFYISFLDVPASIWILDARTFGKGSYIVLIILINGNKLFSWFKQS